MLKQSYPRRSVGLNLSGKYMKLVLACFALLLSYSAIAGSVTLDDLKALSNQNKKSDDVLESLRSDNALEQSDKTFLTFEIDGYSFPAIVLPNGRLAPAVVSESGNTRREACIDRFYQLHDGKYNPKTGGVVCAIRKADLMISEEIDQTSIGSIVVEPPSPTGKADKYGKPPKETVESMDQELEPVPAPEKETVPETGKADKYVSTSNDTDTPKPKPESKPKATPSHSADAGYRPPLRDSGTSTVFSEINTSSVDIEYGIRKGTWAMVETTRRVSSADHGEIELVLLEPIRGKYKDIPAGTILFASKAFNAGTRKLTVQVTNALPIDSEIEIRFSAYGYDLNREAGLSGQIVRDRSAEVDSAVAQGAIAALGSTVNSIPMLGGNPVTDGIAEATDSLVSQEERYVPNAPTAVIEVPSQKFYIQIAKSF